MCGYVCGWWLSAGSDAYLDMPPPLVSGMLVKASASPAAGGGGLSAAAWLAAVQWSAFVLPTLWWVRVDRGWDLAETLRFKPTSALWMAVGPGVRGGGTAEGGGTAYRL